MTTTTTTRDDSAPKPPRIRPQRKNANRHTQRGMGMLEGSIERDGIIGAMTVAADDEVFDGSARAETLPAMGFDLADVAQVVKAEPGRVLIIESDGSSPLVHRRVDIPSADDPKAQRLGVAANRVAQVNLDWEPGVLASVNDEAGLGALFFPDELKDLAQPSLPEPGGGGDDFDATPDEGPTRAQLGDLWIIGGVHRLLVGDCTDPANVARLMGGERLRLIVTDPPYGVSYADKNRYLNAVGRGNRIQVPIEGDHDSIEETAEQLWKPAFASMYDAADRGCSLYCFMPQGGDQMMMMMMMMMSAHWPPRHELIWLKNNHVLGRADYNYKHEPIVYAWKEQGHKFYGGFQTSVLEFAKPQKSDLHPTMKPIELIVHLIGNSSAPGEIIGDWFLGSGTTLIAAHRTGRRCYGCELSPRYADVILRRAEAEGLTVERAESPHEAAVTP